MTAIEHKRPGPLVAGSERSATAALERSTSRNLGLADRRLCGKLTDRNGSLARGDEWQLPGNETSMADFRRRNQRGGLRVPTPSGRSAHGALNGNKLSTAVVPANDPLASRRPERPLAFRINPSAIQRLPAAVHKSARNVSALF